MFKLQYRFVETVCYPLAVFSRQAYTQQGFNNGQPACQPIANYELSLAKIHFIPCATLSVARRKLPAPLLGGAAAFLATKQLAHAVVGPLGNFVSQSGVRFCAFRISRVGGRVAASLR